MDLTEAVKIKDPGNIVRHPWEVTRRKIVTFLLSTQKKFPFQHVADIGTGDGFILQHLLQINAAGNFSAIDPAFNDSITAKMTTWPHSANLHLYQNIREIDPRTGPIDCILLLDVLEHVPDDVRFVIEIEQYAHVSEHAMWLITVPAFQSLFSRHDQQLKHYRRYNLKQLLIFCRKCGLKVDQSGYFFFSLIPPRIIQKLILKFTKKENITTIENWNGGIAISKIIRAALWIDFRICRLLSKAGINFPGLSCYCICH